MSFLNRLFLVASIPIITSIVLGGGGGENHIFLPCNYCYMPSFVLVLRVLVMVLVVLVMEAVGPESTAQSRQNSHRTHGADSSQRQTHTVVAHAVPHGAVDDNK